MIAVYVAVALVLAFAVRVNAGDVVVAIAGGNLVLREAPARTSSRSIKRGSPRTRSERRRSRGRR